MKHNIPRFRYKVLSHDPHFQITDVDRCLYAVSISDDPKSIEKALAGLVWAKSRFPNCAVLLGDSLFRFARNLESDNLGASPDPSDTIINDAICSVKATAGEGIDILSTSSVQNDARYDDFLTEISSNYRENAKFRNSVNNTAAAYVDRQLAQNKITTEQKNVAVAKSTEYLLREIAIYDLLACDGWVTDIYLGQEIEPLGLIISGAIKDCGKMLHMRNNISIRTR